MQNIRNFVIIAHIDHGKSTLADRMLEITGTVEARRMRPQYLDQLELERERGITIKMAPVRMQYQGYILNLIDTPGHSDFSYEVSRALQAVEGAILLVDATKGIQAQTLSNFRAAKKAGLTIIGAVNKIDLNPPNVEKAAQALAELLGAPPSDIFRVSGKTGQGAEKLLQAVIEKVPPPPVSSKNLVNFSSKTISGGEVEMFERVEKLAGHPLDEAESDSAKVVQGGNFSSGASYISRAGAGQEGKFTRALIFDSLYDDHKGILAYLRIFDGELKAGDEIEFLAGGAGCKLKEVGYFAPEFKKAQKLSAGEIGYIATGLKEPALVKIGDTVLRNEKSPPAGRAGEIRNEVALPGYKEPIPVVFISFYPDGDTKFEDLKRALERLRLTDAALSFEPDKNEALGRGLKVGFLGQLHFEITASRLAREFNLKFLTSFPSIAYRVREGKAARVIKDAHDFPDSPDEVRQPMIALEIITPSQYLSAVSQLKTVFDLRVVEMETMGEQVVVKAVMPLAELIRDFDDQLKSVSSGFASFSYELAGEDKAEVEKLEILVAGDAVPALTRIVAKKDAERESRNTVERLKELLPRQQFAQAVQARVKGRIVARETVPALRKDVTGYLYGGDRTRKMKLWQKQKRGKEKLQKLSRVTVPVEVFREILKK